MAYRMERLETSQEWEVLASLGWPCRKDSVDSIWPARCRRDTPCHNHVHAFRWIAKQLGLCFIQVVLLVIGMASGSSTAPALSKELQERFGDTQGSDEHFIEQCASVHTDSPIKQILTRPY